jgi:hypothetical protein
MFHPTSIIWNFCSATLFPAILREGFLLQKNHPKNAPQNSFPQNCGKDFSCAKSYISFNNFFPKVLSRNPLSTNTPTTFDGHWYSIPLHFTHTFFAMTL